MVLSSFRVQNVANRSEPRRINAMHFVQKFKPDSRGLDPATQSPRVGVATDSFVSGEIMRGGTGYMLASRRNGTLYAGVTYNLPERLFQHRTGRGSKFVQKYNVLTLVWYQYYPLYLDAIQRETSIKRWKRAWKIALIEQI